MFPRRRILALFCISPLLLSSCGFEQVRALNSSVPIVPFKPLPIIAAEENPWSEEFHPFIGATAIDVNGDGVMEIFVGGGAGNADSLFFWQDNTLVNKIADSNLSSTQATHGATSIDLDNDGDTDLLLARANGIFLYTNNNGQFSKQQIPVDLPPASAPLNIAVGDIDRDGDGDLYISAFVDFANFKSATFNDPQHAKTNILLRNDGDGIFTDITEESGTASLQNTFLSSFLDLNQDGWLDLVVAQNTGQVELFRNNGDGSFSPQALTTGWGFWMGLAVGDIDADGDQDLFLTNSGTSVPAWILELAGDGTEEQPRNYGWILLRNDGDFKLTDVTHEYQLDHYGFAWGAAFEDLTLDGKLELLVAQNYIKWFVHRWFKLPGKSFVLHDNAYYDAPMLGMQNKTFAQAPLVLDINNDGKPDVFWINMEGAPQAFLNQSENNFITLQFPDSSDSIGVRAYAVINGEAGYTRVLQNNTGFSTDHAALLSLGLGQQTGVEKIVVQWLDGTEKEILAPAINQVIEVNRN